MIARKPQLVLIQVLSVLALLTAGRTASAAGLTTYFEERFPIQGQLERIFVLGSLDGQHGWEARADMATVTHWGQAGRRVGVTLRSRGLGFGFEQVVASPQFVQIDPFSDEDFVMTMLIGFDSTRTGWYVTPKNVTQNSILTRLYFEPGGALLVLVPDGLGGGDFVKVPGFAWEAHVKYSLTLAFFDSGVFKLGINDRLVAVFESAFFAKGIEAIAFETDNNRIGDHMIFDKIILRSGYIGQ